MAFQKNEIVGVRLEYLSPDGEGGFPGNLNCQVVYSLNNENELVIDYTCFTDKKTVVNLTNHSYFNLKDGGKSSAMQHELRLYANFMTPVNEDLTPTGELRSIKNTPFDFLQAKPIGRDIEDKDEQLKIGGGYDHNFVLFPRNDRLKIAAAVYEPTSGRTMEVWTTEPGLQLFTVNAFDWNLIGKNRVVYQRRSAFCLETQHFPNTPNEPQFPAVLLDVGETFDSQTIYKFGVET